PPVPADQDDAPGNGDPFSSLVAGLQLPVALVQCGGAGRRREALGEGLDPSRTEPSQRVPACLQNLVQPPARLLALGALALGVAVDSGGTVTHPARHSSRCSSRRSAAGPSASATDRGRRSC